MDERSFHQRYDEDIAPRLTGAPDGTGDTLRSVIALSELRGFALGLEDAYQSRFIRERVDAILDTYDPRITEQIRRICGNVLENTDGPVT